MIDVWNLNDTSETVSIPWQHTSPFKSFFFLSDLCSSTVISQVNILLKNVSKEKSLLCPFLFNGRVTFFDKCSHKTLITALSVSVCY